MVDCGNNIRPYDIYLLLNSLGPFGSQKIVYLRVTKFNHSYAYSAKSIKGERLEK